MLKKVVDIKTKPDWILKFQLKKSVKKVENVQLFFPPSFSALFSNIAQSCLICACTQENLGGISHLLGVFSQNENSRNLILWNFQGWSFVFSGISRSKVKKMKYSRGGSKNFALKPPVFFWNNPTHSMFDPKNWITSSLKINKVLLFIFDIYKTTWYFKTTLRETLHIKSWKY